MARDLRFHRSGPRVARSRAWARRAARCLHARGPCTIVRMFGMLGAPIWQQRGVAFSPRDAGYWDAIDRAVALANARDLRVNLCAFADAQVVVPDANERRRWLRQFAEYSLGYSWRGPADRERAGLQWVERGRRSGAGRARDDRDGDPRAPRPLDRRSARRRQPGGQRPDRRAADHAESSREHRRAAFLTPGGSEPLPAVGRSPRGHRRRHAAARPRHHDRPRRTHGSRPLPA